MKNGRDGQFDGYSISLSEAPSEDDPDVKSDDAELNFDDALATTGADDDLVYGGHTVTNAIMNETTAYGNNVKLDETATPVVNQGWPNLDATGTAFNAGVIDPADAAYIGAIGATSLYNVCYGKNVELAEDDERIEVAPIAGMDKAWTVKLHMPADFR
ncbi:hypothetical protein, partial [Acutalibacter sp. 1XD8-33]|uniref:hypothetical protein n=1 Tax=Acutalibacter sp. 1XD8-33 TaxID=2320081 RepID=UPI0011C3654D